MKMPENLHMTKSFRDSAIQNILTKLKVILTTLLYVLAYS